jgi:hypothetical protein
MKVLKRKKILDSLQVAEKKKSILKIGAALY